MLVRYGSAQLGFPEAGQEPDIKATPKTGIFRTNRLKVLKNLRAFRTESVN